MVVLLELPELALCIAHGMPIHQDQRELIPPERDERFVRWIPVCRCSRR